MLIKCSHMKCKQVHTCACRKEGLANKVITSLGGVVYFCALATCELAMASTLSPAAPLPETFSNALRAALEWDARKSSSTGVSYGNRNGI